MTMDDLARLIANPPSSTVPSCAGGSPRGCTPTRRCGYEIDTAHRLGFGGMEFLAMDEGDIDHSRYGWGAEEWVHDSQIVVEETTKRNMSVSFTSGTNWSNANLPTIDPDHPAAAKELDVVSEDLRRRRVAQRRPAADRSGGRAGELSRFPGTAARSASRCWSPWSPPACSRRPTTGAVLDVDSVVDLTDAGATTRRWTGPRRTTARGGCSRSGCTAPARPHRRRRRSTTPSTTSTPTAPRR